MKFSKKTAGKLSAATLGAALSTGVMFELIIDDKDWLYIEDTEVADLGESVAYMRIPATGARCTAFKFDTNKIMTNNHCVRTESQARGVRVSFSYKPGQLNDWFMCEKLVTTSFKFDFSVLECEKKIESIPSLKLSPTLMQKDDSVFIVHFNCDYYENPMCETKKIVSYGGVMQAQSSRIAHSADTLGGSSGSPVFDERRKEVIGIHHAGLSGSLKGGRGVKNYAIPMAAILPLISKPSSPSKPIAYPRKTTTEKPKKKCRIFCRIKRWFKSR
mgnify:CR=1 FL=1